MPTVTSPAMAEFRAARPSAAVSKARELLIDVRFWHLADVQTALRNVRFEGK